MTLGETSCSTGRDGGRRGTDGTFTRSQPRILFDSRAFDTSGPVRGYDISPDGRRFVMYTLPPEADPEPVTSLHIVLNWLEELK